MYFEKKKKDPTAKSLNKQPTRLKESKSASTSINNHRFPTRFHQKTHKRKAINGVNKSCCIALNRSLKLLTCATCRLTSSLEMTRAVLRGFNYLAWLQQVRCIQTNESNVKSKPTALHNAWCCFTKALPISTPISFQRPTYLLPSTISRTWILSSPSV